MDIIRLFEGSDLAHGHSIVETSNGVSQKTQAKSWTDKGPPEEKDWRDHLTGEKCLGLAPINSHSKAKWGAIDIDAYDLDLPSLNEQIQLAKLPVILCRSKSGGAHLYLFVNEFIEASKMVSMLETIASHLGYGTSEIFPKQSTITVKDNLTDWGNWINLPYFGGDGSLRYALNKKGQAIQTVNEFVKYASSKTISVKEAEAFKLSEEDQIFPEGPPCLNRIWANKDSQDMRNVSLFNAATYWKSADPENWKEKVDEVNRALAEPLGSSEVAGIIKSAEKKDYHYQCDQNPLSRYCNSSLCRKQRYGVGGKGALPVHRSLTKIQTVPPIWCLDIQSSNGEIKRITMETDDLQYPIRYQKRCMEVLDEVPPVLKKDDWDRVLRTLFRHVNYIDIPYEMSPEGLFLEVLLEFLHDSVSSDLDRTFEDLIRGLPYRDEENHYFRMRDLTDFLHLRKFTSLKPNQVNALIREKLQGQRMFKNISGRGVNFWAIPTINVEDNLKSQSAPEIDENEPF